jgi:hypothetical protein
VSANNLRPVLVTHTDDGGIYVLDLAKDGDMLAVDPEKTYRYIGYVTETRVPSRTKKRKTTSEWYATTLVDTRLGPHKTRPAAQRALLEWSSLVEAPKHATSAPLF